MKRAMCVYLPMWPLQRLMRARPELREQPVAVAQPGPRGDVILICCERSTQAGVRPGMPAAEARAIVPALHVQNDDPASDKRALQKLAAWAERFSPIVGLEEGPAPECLFLDITGCADCFHGEEQLIELSRQQAADSGWDVRIAVADTLGMAWALAHYPLPDGSSLPAACCLLPAAALRLPNETLQTLAALGIERVGQLLDMPRDRLVGRVDPLVLRRLDQMLGRMPELIVPCRLPAEVQARCSFEYAVDRRAVLEHALDRLLDRIVTMLREHQRGVKHLECWFYYEKVAPTRLDVRLFRPSHATDHLRKLLGARLEQVQFTEPVCGICLRAATIEIMTGRQSELFDEAPREEELAGLIDRLVSRLGRDAVTFATLVPDPQPEYACRFDAAVGEPSPVRGRVKRAKRGKKEPIVQYSVLSTQYAAPLALAPRPSSLASCPELIEVLAVEGTPSRLRRNGKEYVVARWWGPERIATGWWRGDDVQRDYYVVETDAGARWWIFRRLQDGRWFVHGWFD